MAKGPRYFYEGFRQQFGDGIGGAVRFALRARDAAKAAEAQQARWDDEMKFRVQQRDALAQEHRENLAAQRSRDIVAAAARADLLAQKKELLAQKKKEHEDRLDLERDEAMDRSMVPVYNMRAAEERAASQRKLQEQKDAAALERDERKIEGAKTVARIGAAGKRAKPNSWADPRTAAFAMKWIQERLGPYSLSSGERGQKAQKVISGAGRLFYEPTLDLEKAAEFAQAFHEVIHQATPGADELARTFQQLWGVPMR